MGVAGVVQFADGGGQQPVGGVHVAVAVEQVIGAVESGPPGLEWARRACSRRRGASRRSPVTMDPGGGFGLKYANLPGGTELGGAQQLGDGADGVAAPQVGVGDFLKERGDPFIGFLGGLG